MSSATWRQFFSFNKYSQITSQALRNSLKESERVKAEKRGLTALRYQRWEDGKGGEQVYLNPPQESDAKKGSAAV